MQKRICKTHYQCFFSWDLRKRHFRDLSILPLPSLFILQNHRFVKSNQERVFGNNHIFFTLNSYFSCHSNLRRPSILENSSYFTCFRIFRLIRFCHKSKRRIFRKSSRSISFPEYQSIVLGSWSNHPTLPYPVGASPITTGLITLFVIIYNLDKHKCIK